MIRQKKIFMTTIALILCGVWLCGEAWAVSGFRADNISTEVIVEGLIPHSVAPKQTNSPDGGRMRGISHTGKFHPGQEPEPSVATKPVVREQPAVALELHFALDSAALTPESVAMLNKVARALEDKRLNKYKFSIEGHTCDLGSAAHNLELSRRRAYAVTEWLTSFSSLSPDQFEIHWFGESCPLVDNTDETHRQKNRCVVIRNTLEQPTITLKERPATLQIIRRQGKQDEVVSDGDVLTQEMPYSLTFKTAEKPYAYICQIDSSGKVNLVFPNTKYSSRQNPIVPGNSYRIPEQADTGFYLDNMVGSEQVVLLAMTEPLADPLSVCKTTFGENTGSPTGADHKRGVGGITSIALGQKAPTTPARSEDIQLCEVVAGGKLNRPIFSKRSSGAKRGVGGIAKLDDSTPVSSATTSSIQEGSCKGLFLKRFFIHQ